MGARWGHGGKAESRRQSIPSTKRKKKGSRKPKKRGSGKRERLTYVWALPGTSDCQRHSNGPEKKPFDLSRSLRGLDGPIPTVSKGTEVKVPIPTTISGWLLQTGR